MLSCAVVLQEQQLCGSVRPAALCSHHPGAGPSLQDPRAAVRRQRAVRVPALSLSVGRLVRAVHQHLQDGVVVPVQPPCCLYLAGESTHTPAQFSLFKRE